MCKHSNVHIAFSLSGIFVDELGYVIPGVLVNRRSHEGEIGLKVSMPSTKAEENTEICDEDGQNLLR